LDTGDILFSRHYDILSRTTAGDLHDQLKEAAGELLLATLKGLTEGTLTPQPQSDVGVTYADKISKDERPIDWSKSATYIHHHIQGLSPYPAATFDYNEETIKVLRSEIVESLSFARAGTVLSDKLAIACGEGSVIRLKTLQRAGKKPMDVEEFLRGFPISKGENLLCPVTN
jgi:methionyl-tRNA formyltransferase